MLSFVALLPLLLGQSAGLPGWWFPTVTWSAPARAPGSVYLFRAGPPDRPAREVGWIHVEASNYGAAVSALVTTAAGHGCDAVGQIQSQYYTVAGTISGGMTGSVNLVTAVGMDGSCYAFGKTPAK
jgi:hypothetical protein